MKQPLGTGLGFLKKRHVPFFLLLLLLPVSGCKRVLYKSTGDIMSSFAVDHMLVDLMGNDDTGMACETGVSMGAFLMSFGRVTKKPRQAGLATYLSAGTCAEERAWEAELRRLRAHHGARSDEAMDARIVEQRAHFVAAKRFHFAYTLMIEEFGAVGTGTCPRLKKDEELVYLLGLSSGVLAVMHDRNANGMSGVPMDIPAAVSRGAKCLDNDKWFGVPHALQGAIGAMMPGAPVKDPWGMLEASAAAGDTAGVRLARAFQVQAAAASGKDDLLRAAIAAHGKSVEKPANPNWKMLDALGTLMVQHESDKIWTQKTGHRTPLGMLGRFETGSDAGTDDSLLEGLP